MSLSDAQEIAVLEHMLGVTGTAPPVATHLTMCTADPEAGSGVSTATRIAIGTWNQNATQVSGRRQYRNTGSRVFTNTTGGSLTVTHIAGMTASTGGAVVFSAALSPSAVLAAGDTLTIAENQLTFDLG